MKNLFKFNDKLLLACIIVSSVSLCLILNCLIPAHKDLDCFIRWGNEILDMGPGKFYDYGYSFPTDYPPLYLLITGFIALICRKCSLTGRAEIFLYRLPSIIFFAMSILLVYKIINLLKVDKKYLLMAVLLFAFSGAIIGDILWGQIDVITLFFVMLAIYLFIKNKIFLTFVTCCLGLLTKAQFLFVLPIIAFALLLKMIKNKELFKIILYSAISLFIFWLGFLPFTYMHLSKFVGITYILQILSKQVGHFNNFCANALNLWFIMALNFRTYPVWYKYINYMLIFFLVVFVCVLYYKKQTNENLIILTSFLFTAIFMLSTNMHERYMIPVLASTIITAFIINNAKMHFINITFYIAQFINLVFSWVGGYYMPWIILPIVITGLSVIALVLFAIEIIRYSQQDHKKELT